MNRNQIKIENLIKVGFNHQNCGLEVRDKVSFTSNQAKMAYQMLKQSNSIKESIILSTCNRSEIYAYSSDMEEGIKFLKQFYRNFFGLTTEEVSLMSILNGIDVVYDIFEVVIGYKSLVKSENQILGQVKNAYHNSIENEASGKVLNRLFLDSITTAKKIKTSLPEKSLSVCSVGLKILEEKLGDFCRKKILLIGLGETSTLVLDILMKKNAKNVYLTTKTNSRLVSFQVKDSRLTKIEFNDRYNVLNDIDCIISCTSAPHYILHKDKFVNNYTNKPLYILDLAVPRDIEPSINDISKVQIINMDDIKIVIEKNKDKIDLNIVKGKQIIKEDVEKYLLWVEKTNRIDQSEKILSNYA